MSYISNCCGAEIKNLDYDICTKCGEHCDFIDEDELEIEEELEHMREMGEENL
jgi:predicted RNA-binding protein associated with RNAse of E/G family